MANKLLGERKPHELCKLASPRIYLPLDFRIFLLLGKYMAYLRVVVNILKQKIAENFRPLKWAVLFLITSRYVYVSSANVIL